MDFIISKLYHLTMIKVAIIIPTLNRPDFLLRQFAFYTKVKSPHPIYISDSSNQENAKEITDGIKRYKNLDITYQWALPGKDQIYKLLPLVKEKYCIQIGDDDFVIPNTIAECADFLENHPDYGTCMGKQVNIRLRSEDYDKAYGLIDRQTRPMGRSLEDNDPTSRLMNFWSDTFFACLTVRRIETERSLRDMTKDFTFVDYMTEFLVASVPLIAGKMKIFDKLGYVMHISSRRYGIVVNPSVAKTASGIYNSEQWKICEKSLTKFISEIGVPEEDSLKVAQLAATLYLESQMAPDKNQPNINKDQSRGNYNNVIKILKRYLSKIKFIKSIYYKIKSPEYVERPESKYFNDFKVVKDFLENKNA